MCGGGVILDYSEIVSYDGCCLMGFSLFHHQFFAPPYQDVCKAEGQVPEGTRETPALASNPRHYHRGVRTMLYTMTDA